jgi:hypothetical protein
MRGTYGGQGKAVVVTTPLGGFAVCTSIDQGGGKRRGFMLVDWPSG